MGESGGPHELDGASPLVASSPCLAVRGCGYGSLMLKRLAQLALLERAFEW